jgi:hypothetical protein
MLQSDSVVGDNLQIPQQEQTQNEERSMVITSETESSAEETGTNNQNTENVQTTQKDTEAPTCDKLTFFNCSKLKQ